MPQKRLWIVLLALALVAMSAAVSPANTIAQDTGNLLRDPGFESTAVWRNVATAADQSSSFNVPPDWNGWVTTQPSTQPWMNLIPNGYPHSSRYPGDPFVHSGNRSQNVARGFATFTAAIFQTVAVPEGSNVTGSAWYLMDIPAGANSQARVGIDPNGGGNPFDSDIVWSAWGINRIGTYAQMTVSATATGPAVTLFLYMTQTQPTDPNSIFWDDASLTIGGAGGSAAPPPGTTPIPTAPPIAAFVNPQAPQADGSIVHTVQSGDTLDAIAFAYGVTRDEIIALNNITNPRFIQVGQQLLIRRASDAEDEADETDSQAAESTEDTPVESTGAAATEEPAASPDPDDPPAPTATFTPRPTSTPAPTAPVAVASVDEAVDPSELGGQVCVMMFEDANMNRIPDQDEEALAGGLIVLNLGTNEVGRFEPDDEQPFCFDELEPGDYVAAGTAPEGYGLTTPTQLRLRVQAGSALNVQFGAAQGVTVAERPPADAGGLAPETVPVTPEDDDDNQLLRISGLILFGLAGLTLVGGLGTMLFLRRH